MRLLVLIESHVEHPVQLVFDVPELVFDVPVRAGRLQKPLRIGPETADKQARFPFDLFA